MGKETPPTVAQSRPDSLSFVYVYGQRLPNKLANSGAVLNLCKALAQAGHRVTLAYLGEPEDEPAIRAAYDLPPTFQCTALPSKGRGLYYPAMAFTALRRSGAEIVITRMPQVAVMAALLGKPTILELHQHLELFSRLQLWSKFLWLVRPNRLSIVATTPGIRKSLHPLWRRKAAAIATLPSAALDLAGDGSPSTFDVGYVGSFMPGKGVEKVHAMAEALPKVSFVVYGDPTSGPDAAASLEALPNVTLGGFVPNKDIATALASFRIGVAPYASTGFGGSGDLFFRMDSLSSLKVLEYMSAAKAIVSSRISAIEDCVEDGQSALLCNPDDDGEWIRAVSLLANDPSLSQRLARNAREAYLERFTYSVRAGGFVKLAGLMRGSTGS